MLVRLRWVPPPARRLAWTPLVSSDPPGSETARISLEMTEKSWSEERVEKKERATNIEIPLCARRKRDIELHIHSILRVYLNRWVEM